MSESENEKIIRGLDKMGFVQCDHSKSPSGSFNNAMYQAGIKTFKRSGVLLGGHTKYVLVYKGKYMDRPKTTKREAIFLMVEQELGVNLNNYWI
jgi:hypothetical protein